MRERADAILEQVREVPDLALLLELAQIAKELRDDDLEITAYEQIRELEPGHADAIRVLAEHYTLREDWAGLASVLLDRGDPTALEMVARMYEDKLGDPQAAFMVWTTLVRHEPEDAHIEQLVGLGAKLDAWDDIRELAEDLEDPHPSAAARVWRLVATRQDDRAALAHAVRLDPSDRDTFMQLVAALRLEERWKDLGALLARRVEIETEGRGALYVELGVIHDKLGQADDAIAWYERARGEDPEARHVLEALHRLYRDREAWPKLAELIPHLLAANDAPDLSLQVQLAEAYEQIGDVERATTAYRVVAELDPDHRPALEALARLHERAARPQQMIDALKRLIEHTRNPKARADLFQRIGTVYAGMNDATNARLNFVQSLALDLDNAAAREGMARVHVLVGEHVAAGEEMTRAANLSTTQSEKIRRLAEAAAIYDKARDVDRARQCRQQILDLEPDHADARQMLHDTKQWAALWPYLERDLARSPDAPTYLRAARVALELDKKATALELYELAAAADPSPATLFERAEALVRCESFIDASAVYQAIAALDIEREHRTRALFELGRVQVQLDPQKARESYERLLELEPQHRESLDALVELHIAGKHVEEAIAKLRAISEIVPDKLPVLERIGDLLREEPARAIEAYREALALAPTNHRLLQRLLDAQSATADWSGALDTIDRFIACESDPVRRAPYYLAAAEILRNELADKPRALAAYASALDDLMRKPPSGDIRQRALDVFRSVSELIAEDRDWPKLAKWFLAMIERLPKDDPAQVVLWQTLGELYHVQLADFSRATDALERAHALDAERTPARAKALAELYTVQATTRDPDHLDAIRARGRAAFHSGKVDEAWCIARMFVFFDKATAVETELYTRYADKETRKATGALEDDAWTLVRHPDEDRTISRIFALTWFGPTAAAARPPKAYDLKPKERLREEETLAQIFRHVSRVLCVKPPEIYVQPDREGRLWFANCIDQQGLLSPALIAGRDLSGDAAEVSAWIAALLALLCPPYVLRLSLAGIDELESALAAGAHLVGRRAGRTELESLKKRYVSEIEKRLSGQVPDALHALVAKLPPRLDIAKWRDAVDMTARRASLLVCGKLEVAARLIARDANGVPDAEQLRDLVSYSVSPAYFKARALLGVQVA